VSVILLLVLLTVVFAGLVGFSAETIVIGAVVSIVVMSFVPKLPDPLKSLQLRVDSGRRLVRFLLNAMHFMVDFLRDLLISNFYVAYDVWTPRDHFSPTIVFVPIDDLSDIEVALLATRISLTPGTLSMDVSADRRFLLVHSMYPSGSDDSESLRRPIQILKKGL
jgi:multicomponent Na+:H+ antiporter subunit E